MTATIEPATDACTVTVTDHHAHPWPVRLWRALTDPRAREAYQIGRALRRRHLNPATRRNTNGWVLLDAGNPQPFTLGYDRGTPVNRYTRALHRGGWTDLGVHKDFPLIDIHPRRNPR